MVLFWEWGVEKFLCCVKNMFGVEINWVPSAHLRLDGDEEFLIEGDPCDHFSPYKPWSIIGDVKRR